MIAHSESFKDLTKGLDVLLSGEFKVPVFLTGDLNTGEVNILILSL